MFKRNSVFRLFLLGILSIAATATFAQVPLDSLERMYARTRYMQYLGKTEKELKALPKQDRPDLAVEQDYLRTLDPALGRPAPERLVQARAYADLLRAQDAVPGDANNAWVERGPVNVGGRTRALVWDPTSVAAGGNKVWAGGVTGGLWYNNDITNANSTWLSAGNSWDNIAISAMAFDPTNPLVAYVGTGEGWFAGSSRGAGVWKTTNGGQSWTQLATTVGFLYINDIVVRNEGGVGVPYIAVDATFYAGQWSPGFANHGVYRSTNGGTSWSKITLPTASQAVSDLEIDADNTLWAGTRRSPYANNDGGQIAKSTNGTSWTVAYTQSAAISGGRTELAVGGSGAGLRVYAVFESSSAAFNFIKTSNGGTTWSSAALPVDADLGIGADFTRGQAWYDLILQVDPNNADIVYAGGIDLFRSTNGAANWTQISKWSNNNNLAALTCPWVHADQHAITFRPGSSSAVVFGNDGGVFYSSNIASAATDQNAILPRNTGYNVTQFYSCAIHPGSGSNNFLAGAQDNGTQRFTSVGMNATSDVIGGDGAYCFIDQTNGNYQIGSYVYNNFYRSTNGGSSFSTLMSFNTGDFINPAAYDSENNILFTKISGTNIYRVPGIQTTPTTPTSVAITNTDGSISHIKVSPYAPAGTTTLYLGSTTGRVLRVPNAHTGTTLTGTVLAANLAAGSISCIEIGANENTLLVTFTNYGVNSVWMTTDGGATWVSKEANLPDMPIRWALIHPTNANEALLATELGTWATTNLLASSPTWVPSNSGLANVRVDMLQYRSSDKMVAAATYGRGLFTSNAFAQTPNVQAAFSVDNPAPCQGSTVQLTDASLGNPNAWNWTITPSGATFVNSTSSSSQNPQVQFTAPGVYTVRLIASNALSSDTATQTSVISVGQIGLPYSENFENAANRAQWSVVNPDNSTTWTFATGITNTTGSNSAFIDNWNYSASGQRDGLVSPPISLASASAATLSFRHAYRPYDNTATYSDSMAVYVSTNCGTSWTRVASFKETNFTAGGTYTWNTAPGLDNALFAPTANNQWCGTTSGGITYASCKSINLSAYAGQEIRIKFENINSYGQGFYLDDIQLSASSVTSPTASFTSSATTICSGSTVSFTNTSTGTPTSYSWSVTPGTITYASGTASSASPSIQFNAAGTYTVQLTATNSGGSNSTTATLTVNAVPAAPTGSASQSFCNSGTVANLIATGSGVKWYSTSTGGSVLSTSTALTNGTTYYASQTVSGCESATRLAVTATINAPAAPTGSASQSFCNSGTVASLTATGTSIKWYSTSTGGSVLSTSTALTNGTMYYASQTVSGCESAARLAVAATINAPAAPTGSASQSFCNSGTVANLTATGTSIQWYSTSTGGSVLSTSTALTNGTTYYASQTVSGCESATRLAVTATINVPAAPTGSASQSFCNSGTVASLTAAGTTIQWYAASTGGTALSTSTALTNGTVYYASQTVSSCESATRLAVTSTINVIAAPTGSASQSFCNSGTVSILTATGTFIQWYSTSTGGSVLSTSTALTNGTTYYASQTVSGCESATRLAVTATINVPAAPTGSASQSFCNSGTVANLTAAGTTIQWYAANTGGTALSTSTALTNGTVYYASQTVSGCESATRLAVTATINMPAAPTGSAAQTFCNSGTVASLTATGTSIQWYAASTGGTALSTSTALTNGTIYFASQTVSSCESAARLAVTATINAPTAPAGSAAQSFCNSGTVANLTATGTSIQWYSTSTGGSVLNTSLALTSGSTYYASQTVSGCESSTRLAVTATINAPAAPTGSASQSFCNSGTVASLTAIGNSIQWFATNTGGSVLSTSLALTSGTNYYASQTISGCESATRLAVTATINVPSAPTGSAAQSFCNSGTVASLTATGTSIKWYSTSTGGSVLNTSTALTNGTTYYASQTVSGCESATRLAVTATINAPAAPTGTAAQTFCNSGTVASLTATGTAIQWYAASTGGTALSTSTALTNGTTYYATQTVSGCESVTRLAVTSSINIVSPPVAIATQFFCPSSSPTVVDLSPSGVGILWYGQAIGGTPLISSTSLALGATYYAAQVILGCESSLRTPVLVQSGNPSAPTGSTLQTFCNSGTVANLTAAGTAIQWYAASTGGTALSTSTALTNGTIYYASQTVSGCESATRLAVTVVINAPAAPTGSAAQTFCNSGTVASLTATGTAIQWYATSTGGTALSTSLALTSGTTYYASQTVSGCESATRLAVTATINAPAAPSGSATQTFCNSGTVANLTATGTTIQWYAASTGGTALSTGTALTNGTIYYASQTVSSCESTTRLAVTATINAPAAPTGSTSQTFCNNGTVASLTAMGTAIQWYAASTGGTPLSSTAALTTGTTYYASQTVSGCESAARLAVTATINAPIAPSGSAAPTFCNSATVANLMATGTGIQWYAASTGGTALSTSTALSNGTTYYASQTVNGCESAARLAVTATINAPAAPTGTSAQTFCNSGTVASLTATGTSIEWYSTNTGGSVLSTSTSLTNGTTYYASQTVSGCESAARLAVTATINAPAAPTGSASQTFCNSGTVANLTAAGTAIQWYATSTGGTALSTNLALTSGTTYYASQTVSGCESATRLAVTATINTPAAPTGSSVQTFCSGANVAQLVALGTNLQWYSANAGGSPLSTSAVLTNGTTYYASQTLSGCESAVRFPVVAIVNTTPAPTGSATQAFCNGGTVSNLTAAGTAIQWYAASTGGTALSTSTSLANGTTYYAEQTLNNCPSVARLAVTAQVQPQPSATILVQGPTDYCANQTISTNFALSGLQPASSTVAWRRNGTVLSGATGTSYLATQIGYYDAVLESLPGCATTVPGDSLAVQTPPILTPITGQSWAVQGVTQQYQVLGSTGGTLQWTATGGVIASGQGTTTANVAWLANGTLEVTSTNGACVETQTLNVVLSGVGLEEPTDRKGAVLYPNPTLRFAQITPWSAGTTVRVYATDGRLLSVPCADGILDFDGFAAGLYQVVVWDSAADQAQHLRVQVQR